MRIRSVLSLIGLSATLYGAAIFPSAGFAQEPTPLSYSLESILDLALSRNPAVASTEGLIDQQRGQQTAAGAYPNPTVTGYLGYGEVRDTGRANIRESLDRESLTDRKSVV